MSATGDDKLDFTTAGISKKIIYLMIAIGVVIIIGGVVFHRTIPESLYFAAGVVLATGLNIIRIKMLEQTARKLVELNDDGSSKASVGFSYIFRFLLTVAVFVAAAMLPFIDLFGAVFGIFTLPISMHLLRFVIPKSDLSATPADENHDDQKD